MIYYVNSRFHVPLLDMGMALIVAVAGLVLVTIAERQILQPSKEEMKAATSPERQMLALFKFTLTPIATRSQAAVSTSVISLIKR